MTTVSARLDRVGPVGQEDFVTSATGQLVQVCRGVVDSAGGGEQRITLFMQADHQAPPLTSVSLAALASGEAPGVIAALLHDMDDGRVTVQTEAGGGKDTLAVAAVAAVMRASWAWDENPVIEVIVNGSPIRMAPRFTGEVWQATEIAIDAL